MIRKPRNSMSSTVAENEITRRSNAGSGPVCDRVFRGVSFHTVATSKRNTTPSAEAWAIRYPRRPHPIATKATVQSIISGVPRKVVSTVLRATSLQPASTREKNVLNGQKHISAGDIHKYPHNAGAW